MSNVTFKWFGDGINRDVHRAIVNGLFGGIQELLGEANRIVPYDQNRKMGGQHLRATGLGDVDEPTMTAYVSYDTAYAVRLHEHPEYHFQRPGEGKWLEKTFKNHGPRVTAWVANRVKAALRG